MITDTLKSELLKTFRNEKKLNSAIENKNIYFFDKLNVNQLLKVFNTGQQDIFTETNSKKHLSKIYEMIRSYFTNPKTNHYLSIFLQAITDKEEYEKRKSAIEKISKIELDDETKVKEIIKNIQLLKTEVIFNNRIFTLDAHAETFLFESYKINAQTISKKELEEMMQTEDLSDAVLITQEDLFIELPIYTLKEFQKLIVGNIIKTNAKQILNISKVIKEIDLNLLIESIKELTGVNLEISLDFEKLEEILYSNSDELLKELTNKTLRLEEDVEILNKQLKEVISKKQLSLQGDELLELLNSGDMQALQNKFKSDVEIIVNKKEKEILEEYSKYGINLDSIFVNSSYPLSLDPEVKDQILTQIDSKGSEMELELYEKLGKFDYVSIKRLWDIAFCFDFAYAISTFIKEYELKYPTISNELSLINARNMYIKNAMPISYGIGTHDLELKGEKVSILTGANSGGKTTLLEMFLQAQILTSMGMPIAASENSKMKLLEEVIYLKKFTGTQGSGAFEQTIRNLIEILDNTKSKLILIDEFEAITEPGAAAKILIMFLKEIQNQDALCIGVSHLGQEIQEFIKEEKIEGIRIDGISAEGLDEKGNLITKHQPKFYELGKSTPELILKRILQDDKFWKGKSNKSRNLLEKICN